jgi:hypothetical protein
MTRGVEERLSQKVSRSRSRVSAVTKAAAENAFDTNAQGVADQTADDVIDELEGETVNATRQTEDMAMAWAEVQKKMWEHLMKGIESSVRPQYAESWERASGNIIDAWENSVKLSLQAQADWTGIWARRLGDDERSPKEVVEWARQMYELMKSWNSAQLEMWESWFASVRKFGPVEYTSAFVDVSKSWREAARKSLDAEAEWMRAWAEQGQRVAAAATNGNG